VLTTRHPSVHKSSHYISPTSVGRSVGKVRLQTKGHGIYFNSCVTVDICLHKPATTEPPYCLIRDRYPQKHGFRIMVHLYIYIYIYIVTCSTEGHRCYATFLSLLRNRGRVVPWIRSRSRMVTNSVGCIATNSGKASVGCYGNQQ
jgi:hypothetical protein